MRVQVRIARCGGFYPSPQPRAKSDGIKAITLNPLNLLTTHIVISTGSLEFDDSLMGRSNTFDVLDLELVGDRVDMAVE